MKNKGLFIILSTSIVILILLLIGFNVLFKNNKKHNITDSNLSQNSNSENQATPEPAYKIFEECNDFTKLIIGNFDFDENNTIYINDSLNISIPSTAFISTEDRMGRPEFYSIDYTYFA